jgi:MFS family permease
MADWSAIFLRTTAGASESIAAIGYAAFSIAMAAGRFTGDRLTARLGPERLLRWNGALATGGLLLMLLLARPATSVLGFAIVGAGFATVVPLVFSAAGRTRGIDPGAALATTTTLGYAGFLIGPPFIGFLAQLFTLRYALAVIAGTSALLVILAPCVSSRVVTSRRSKSSPGAEALAETA